jgi:catechol 2,3-dioxygenase-like lactoylglutathione lyase family enzyme
MRPGAEGNLGINRKEISMKRFHVHMGVADLATSIRFYSQLFAAEPTVQKPDYAKWMLDDPRVNFAISQDRGDRGIHHLGVQVENEAELAEIYGRLEKAGAPVLEEGATVCCYAESEKAWIGDPDGMAWEAFLTRGESTIYGGNGPATGGGLDAATSKTSSGKGCCVPASAPAVEKSCCGSSTRAA